MANTLLPTGTLQGMRVAILLENGFEEAELLEPKWALEEAGAATFVISSNRDRVTASTPEQAKIPVDIHLSSARAEDFHALLLPGGTTNTRGLATNTDAVRFVKYLMHAGKPVAAIGVGPATILSAQEVRGRTMTCDVSLENELRKRGACYVDKDVVCDGNLVTSRRPDDIPAFIREMIRVFGKAREHSRDMRKIP